MKKLLFLLALCVAIVLSSCGLDKKTEYYSERSNYITAIGTISHIKYNEENDVLYLGIEQLSPEFADIAFKIVGKNLLIVQENGIDQKLQIGKQIEFISAPRYFGDGYVMPIVGVTIDGEVLLDFEQGYYNWLEWIESMEHGA